MVELITKQSALDAIDKESEFIEREINDATKHPDEYTDNFIPFSRERQCGLADAYIAVDELSPVETMTEGDLISRQAAVDVIINAYDGTIPYTIVKDLIKALPSAQPKHLTEIDMDSWERGYEQGKLWAKAEREKGDISTDLISRQDAIDALCKQCTGESKSEYCGQDCMEVEALRALPSADITNTEACKKCQEATERVLNNQGEKIKELDGRIKESESAKQNGDFISRQATMEEFARHDCTNGEVQFFTGKDVQEILKIIPSAETVYGEWNRLSRDTFHCKICGRTFIVLQGEESMNFCPQCGQMCDWSTGRYVEGGK